MKHALQFLTALAAGAVALLLAMGVFVGIWGWQRFLLDFWPLDASRVGPNLVASLVLIVLVVAHNQFVVVRKGEQQRESHKQMLQETIRELMHPTVEIEEAVAEDIEERFRNTVLDLLNEATPGGLGAIMEKLGAALNGDTGSLLTKPGEHPYA